MEFTPEIDIMFKRKLIVDRKIYAAHYWHNGHWWTRCSAQVWNEASRLLMKHKPRLNLNLPLTARRL